jgi:hypothetical protein
MPPPKIIPPRARQRKAGQAGQVGWTIWQADNTANADGGAIDKHSYYKN